MIAAVIFHFLHAGHAFRRDTKGPALIFASHADACAFIPPSSHVSRQVLDLRQELLFRH